MDPSTPGFDEPYLDVDEWRDAPVRHRYVHGGFTGTGTRFSLYFPPPEQYQGRFFQHITPVPDSEHLAQSATGREDKIGFAVSSGAYFVETNGGGSAATPGGGDPTVTAYLANAAVARHSRTVARDMYGDHRTYGYAYGGSGGGYRTIGGAENTEGVWDGFVPYVIGSPMAIPNVFSVRMHAQRVLRGSLGRIADAADAGSRRPLDAGLGDEERQALAEVTKMGFPTRSWFGHATMGFHAFGALYPHVAMVDPGYFEEFWTVPGHEGADPASSVHRDRVRHRCATTGPLDRDQAGALGVPEHHAAGTPRGGVDHAFKGPDGDKGAAVAVGVPGLPADAPIQGADLRVLSGEAAGARVTVMAFHGDAAVLDTPDRDGALAGLRPGDTVEIDNSAFLAAQTYHRHQVPDDGYPVWDQFRNADGTPSSPQRPFLVGPLFTEAASGHLPTGRFSGKMIVVSCLLDREAFPWQADWYRGRVRAHLGDRTDEHFRLWYVDHALHGDDEQQEHPTRTVSYLGVLHQALRRLSAWVETGRAPADGTRYTVSDGQVHLPDRAADRRGVQPVVTLTADGGDLAEVPAGRSVRLRAVVETPPDAGVVVAVDWDFDGTGAFEATSPDPAPAVTVERDHVFTEPGAHFVTVRATSQPDGDPATPYARVDNLARVRVVVG
ncbi:Tat pathway signal sequence domain protein [Yinghuangia sp. ASG 101]|uniref:Tat pathway signal sequence domain protein n=1 Tax=Yinghuangia sp. ASG 101 TaxID=2896848 RepID=UPI001E377B74|nr:Tat pathway signal sequence domain protein [Yinghuangia sp. ASG 101]UGQ11957.1 Tat pathway signal sequence domain protein [Yinghuangia sp. ASG 101]